MNKSCYLQGCRRAGTWYLAECAFRYLLSNQPERFVLSVPALICNGPKKSFSISRRKKREIFRKLSKRSFQNFSRSAPALQTLLFFILLNFSRIKKSLKLIFRSRLHGHCGKVSNCAI